MRPARAFLQSGRARLAIAPKPLVTGGWRYAEPPAKRPDIAALRRRETDELKLRLHLGDLVKRHLRPPCEIRKVSTMSPNTRPLCLRSVHLLGGVRGGGRRVSAIEPLTPAL